MMDLDDERMPFHECREPEQTRADQTEMLELETELGMLEIVIDLSRKLGYLEGQVLSLTWWFLPDTIETIKTAIYQKHVIAPMSTIEALEMLEKFLLEFKNTHDN